MNLKKLIKDERTSIGLDGIDVPAYRRDLSHLKGYVYWDGAENTPRLWEHQQAAISTVVAYINGDKRIPERPEQKEAALLKLPTGTGKSGIIAVLARCLPDVRRILVLTPRTALTEQLLADIRHRFWKHMGFEHEGTALFTAEAEEFGRALESAYVEQFLPKNVGVMVQHQTEPDSDRVVLVGTHQALGDIRKKALNPDLLGSEGCATLINNIRDSFDLVIVDEGHYEPAISWSQGVRELNLPTLLLSATPYRNDYKSFRVRGRYLFNFPYSQAVEKDIIRPAKIIVPQENTEPLGHEAAINQFVASMHHELPSRLTEANRWFRNGTTPKVMVRGDDVETLVLLV
jgi:superfamily II DNA or RNA helicase